MLPFLNLRLVFAAQKEGLTTQCDVPLLIVYFLVFLQNLGCIKRFVEPLHHHPGYMGQHSAAFADASSAKLTLPLVPAAAFLWHFAAG